MTARIQSALARHRRRRFGEFESIPIMDPVPTRSTRIHRLAARGDRRSQKNLKLSSASMRVCRLLHRRRAFFALAAKVNSKRTAEMSRPMA